MTAKKTSIIAFLFLLISCVLGLALFGRGRQDKGLLVVGSEYVVTEVTAHETVAGTGSVKPDTGAEVRVGPRVSGQLAHLYVKVGDFVKKGQALAKVDDAGFVAEVNQSKARLDHALTEVRLAKAKEARRRSLFEQGLISSEEMEGVRAELDLAESNMKLSKAQLDQALIDLGYTEISSPIDGTVASISTQEGETVAASFAAPTFVTVVDLQRLHIETYVDEIDISGIEEGLPVHFTIDALPSHQFNGHILAINPQAILREGVVNYSVIVKIDDSYAGLLRPDMSATVSIDLGTSRKHVAVPEKALVHKEDRVFVYVKSGNSVVERGVSTGNEQDGLIAVDSGLSAGDVIIIPAKPEDQNENK